MKQAWKVKEVVEMELLERDNRITQLERELAEARKPRQRVLLIGGPSDGDTQLVEVPRSSPYIITVSPRQVSAAVYNTSASAPDIIRLNEHYYRLDKIRTGDGLRLIAVYERSI